MIVGMGKKLSFAQEPSGMYPIDFWLETGEKNRTRYNQGDINKNMSGLADT